MLHAFNQKNARRITLRRDGEHRVEKLEDAVTSMVFSPLAFMTPVEALRALAAIVGDAYLSAIAGRQPIRHTFHLWPGGLVAPSWDDTGSTRCEPDLLAVFEFSSGPPVVFIGEMKWNWRMSELDLTKELKREREAVRGAYRNADQIVFVVSKYRPVREIQHAPILTWSDVSSRLLPIERADRDRPSTIWASLVRTFLRKADQVAFTGLGTTVPSDPRWARRPAFYEATT